MASPARATASRAPAIPPRGPRRAVALLKRAAFGPAGRWEKEDILDTMFWMRVLLALVLGVAAGLGGRTGAPVFFLHIAVSVVLVLAWARGAGVDDDDVGGLGGLVGEGLSQGIALFSLCWILCYTQTQTA